MGVLLFHPLLRLLRPRPTDESASPAAPARPAAVPAAPAGDARRAWLAGIAGFLSTAPVPIVLIDLDHRMLAWNSAFAAFTGRSPETLEHHPVEELIDEEGRDWLRRQLRPDHGPDAGARFGRIRMTVKPDAEMLITGSQYLEQGVMAGWYLRFNADPSIAFEDPSVQGLVERVSREKERLAALLTVSHAVVNSLDLDTILATIAQQVRQVIEVDECTVFLIDAAGETLVPAVCDASRFRDEMMSMRLKVGEGITGTVAQTGRGEIVNSAEDDPRAAHVPGTPPEQSSLMCVPMIAREKVQGVITLARLGTRSFERIDLELATLFAGQCSTALANARIYDELRRAYDEVREAQAQLVQSAKLNALGEMAAGVAHDFNNILTVIQGYTKLVAGERHLEPQTVEALDLVMAAADRASLLTRQLLTFSRRQATHPQKLNLNELVENTAAMLGRILGEDIALSFDCAPQLPLVVADAGMIEQVLLNLAVN
jgi:GAF domain-containing protein/PAS domain-containing protein